MEEKDINVRESISIITQMIDASRSHMERNVAFPILVWGYCTAFLSIVIFALLSFTHNDVWEWLWWALPLVAGPLSFFIGKRHKSSAPTPFLAKALFKSWIFLGLLCIIFSAFSFLDATHSWWNILIVIIGIVGSGNAITGFFLRYRVLWITALASIIISTAMAFVPGYCYLIVFAICFIIMEVVPGHLILYKYKH